MSGSECVKVAVRIRPMSQSEKDRGCQVVIEQTAPEHQQIVVCGGRKPTDIFTFSYVFPRTAIQSQVYEHSVSPLLNKLIAGYNATILAYGQTSSGKTFTMGTDFIGEMSQDVGVIPRAITDIFRLISDGSDGAPCAKMNTNVTCSFIEVYQDNVYDLLKGKSDTDRHPVEIRETVNGDIVLQGLTEIEAATEQRAFDCLVRGSTSRVVRATTMNNVSSRSHAIFTLTLQQTARNDPSMVTRSKFHLVDLAGSERTKKTETTGKRFREGVEINKCLLALGNVITALGTASGTSKVHVPYRSSKLTRLLQDSLGGNSYTLMIACVSPADYNLSETYSTLRYANRVLQIKNKPIINQDPQHVRIKELEATVQDLRIEILALMSGCRGNGDGDGQDEEYPAGNPGRTALVRGLSDLGSPRKAEPEQSARTQAAVGMLQANNRLLQKQLQSALHELGSHEMRAMIAEKLLDDIEQVMARYAENSAEPGKVSDTAVAEGAMRREISLLLTKYNEEAFAQVASHQLNPHQGRPSSAESEEIARKSQLYTEQQIRKHLELSQLKRELALKEELQRKCTENSTAVVTLTITRERELTEQLRECEGQIRVMEEQLTELNALLENTKANEKRSKLAEERRRKVLQLESELVELRRKSVLQAKMLKLSETNAERIAGLSTEIQKMKNTRVQLQKALRTETENFRQWRLNQQKEITQLKAKDRKRECKLKKLESTYTLQKRIMQRKMDETILVNKRLKATLERRQRNPMVTVDRTVMRGPEASRWIKHELELICNTVEASVTLKMLSTQRAQQAKKRNQLRDQLAELNAAGEEDPGADGSMDERRAELEDELRQCESDLEYRNAQIVDLQQKIHTMDTETQLATFGEGLASLPESLDAFQRLLEKLVHSHTRLFETRFELVELQATSECQEEALGQTRTQLQQAEQHYKEKVVQLERTYEEKLSFLLMQRAAEGGSVPGGTGGGDAPHKDTVHEEAIQRIEQLRNELEEQKKLVQELQNQQEAAKLPRRKPKLPSKLQDHDMDMDDPTDEDAEALESEVDSQLQEQLEKELDPDFRGTPINKRKKSTTIRELVLPNKTLNTTINCSCTGNCGTKRCGCQKHEMACHPACKCPPNCVNRTLSTIGEGENMPLNVTYDGASASGTAVKQEDKENTFVVPTAPAPVVKDERDELDILEYVAKYRKRKPLLDI